ARAAGAHVVIVDGRLTAYIVRGRRELAVFLPQDEPLRSGTGAAAATALARWAGRARGPLGWSEEDGRGLAESPLAPYLKDAGFVPWGPGFRLPPRRREEPEPVAEEGE